MDAVGTHSRDTQLLPVPHPPMWAQQGTGGKEMHALGLWPLITHVLLTLACIFLLFTFYSDKPIYDY